MPVTQLIMTGQLFYGQNEAGPMFQIFTPFGASEIYGAHVISPFTCEIIAQRTGFTSFGDAVEWVRQHCEY